MRGVGNQIAGALLVFLIFFNGRAAPAQESGRERLVLESADQLENRLIAGQFVRILRGNVRFRQGTATLSCQEARQYTREGLTTFRRDVRLVDGARKLRAEELDYLERKRLYIARRHVQFSKGASRLFSDELRYFRDERRLVADGNVVLEQTKERLRITSGHGEYLRDRDYARVTQKPVLVQLDSLGRELTRVVGDTMESFEGGKRFKVTGHVQIEHENTRARCAEAEYFADEQKIVLRREPVAWQEQDELHGEIIELHLRDRKIEEVHVLNRAVAFSPPDTTLGAEMPNILSGKKLVFHLQNGEVDRIVVETTATSIYNMIEDGKFKGINWVQGDRITLLVKNRTVRRVSIESRPGTSTGKFLPPGYQLTAEDLAAVPKYGRLRNLGIEKKDVKQKQ